MAISTTLSSHLRFYSTSLFTFFPRSTSPQTLILSVICSQGLPAYTENWEALIDQNFNLLSQGLPGQEFVINWFRMGGVVLNAADVWATIAHRNYEAKLLEIQANVANNASEADLSELQTQARQLEVDLKRKENAKVEATELRDNPHQLAQRTIMMLAALQEKVRGFVEQLNAYSCLCSYTR